MIKRISIITILILVVNLEVSAQNNKKQMLDSLKIVEAFVRAENFTNAINFYKRFLLMNPKNPKTNYDLGFCLLNTATGKMEAVKYLEISTKLYKKKKRRYKAEYFKSYFYLARAYRANYEFEKAMAMYYPLLESTKQKSLKEEIKLEIELCKDGISFVNKPKEVEVTNLGETVNSYATDHSPVFSGDESILIFTSRREVELPGIEAYSDMDGQYDENIFICHKDSTGNWTAPKSISNNINTAEHEATIALSLDGRRLFLYREDDDGTILESFKTDSDWTKPRKLGPTINTQYRETHASFTADGRYIYFTSDRPGGLGKLDIYMAEMKKTGRWGEAKNVGTTINSEADEESPNISADGKTLFFSSKKRGGLGGYDIYKSTKNEFGTWTKPENIGYPINTIDDDVFYLPTADGTRAYYSSQQSDGFGWDDLYLVTMKNKEENQVAIISGYVFTCAGDLPKSEITLTQNQTNDEWYYHPDTYNGKFVLLVYRGKTYKIVVETNGKVVYENKFTVPNDAAFNSRYNEKIRLDPFVPCLPHISNFEPGQVNLLNVDEDSLVYDENIRITVQNFLFDFNKNKFLPNPKSNIVGLIHYLKLNPTAVIEIGAYTDSKGTADYNYNLAEKRGNSLKKYLLKNGVAEHQLVVTAYGEENPLAFNKIKTKFNEESQKYNRRIEFRILEFGKSTLLIRQIDNIPATYKNPGYDKKYKKLPENTFECGI